VTESGFHPVREIDGAARRPPGFVNDVDTRGEERAARTSQVAEKSNAFPRDSRWHVACYGGPSQEAFVRSALLAVVFAVLGLRFGTSAGALTSQSQGGSGDSNGQLYSSSSWGFSLLSFYQSSSGGWGDGYQLSIENVINLFWSSLGQLRDQVYGTDGAYCINPPRDAGYVPEPGAVGVFSVGLLIAGALIRSFARTS
jgi:hypothetical protein